MHSDSQKRCSFLALLLAAGYLRRYMLKNNTRNWELNMKKALLLIDVQNDYFPEGAFPLWNTEKVLSNIESTVQNAIDQDIPIIVIQHVADSSQGLAPFFNENSPGVEVHPSIMSLIPNACIVVKKYADSFHETNLESALEEMSITELLICGMMTQNCVTHTAISKSAEKYSVSVIMDCCTTVSEMIHLIAIHALSTRVKLISSKDAFTS
jgi:nicotinamidase-related amidase